MSFGCSINSSNGSSSESAGSSSSGGDGDGGGSSGDMSVSLCLESDDGRVVRLNATQPSWWATN